ncbi:membrane-spanning 4-domains subfamily A member 4A-like [Mixophyes fleayi]|uniref:membrane-spanning 4-domains subfamily A member 4A-like n=1 Tax=Mixophyes fleayi TaxID=3061075 RepID=UPI003F4E3D84
MSYETMPTHAFPPTPKLNTVLTTPLQNVTSRPAAYRVSPAAQEHIPPQVSQWALAFLPQNILSTVLRTFLKSKPQALGIVLIAAAILDIALGIGLAVGTGLNRGFILSFISGISFLGTVLYIIAGSLTIAAHTKPNICLVKGSLSLNIISSIVSFISLIINSIDLALSRPYPYYRYDDDYYRYHKEYVTACVLASLLLVIHLLVFSVSLSVSIFGCRSLSHIPTNVTQVFVMQKDGVASVYPSTVQATSQLLPSTMPTV